MREGRVHNVCLVADDDLFIRKIIAKNLDNLATIVNANDGADCLQAYQEHKPDIAFVDIHLPILTGLELVDQILRIDPQAYIILISSDSTSENVQAAIAKGAKGFLAKPILREKLIGYFSKCPTVRWADGQTSSG